MSDSEYKLFALCQDWKSFEEAIEVIYMLQNQKISKLEMINRLKTCFSPLATLIENGLAESYQLTPLQTNLGLLLFEGTQIHSNLALSKSKGELPIKDDIFGEFCDNELFLHLRIQPTNKEVLSTQQGIDHFCAEMNKMSPIDGWGDLVSSNVNEYLQGVKTMTKVQVQAAEHFTSHRNCYLQVIQEIESSMKIIDPFWKNRLFIYKEAFLQVKVMSEMKPDSFQIWLEEQKMFDPEMFNLMNENMETFKSYSLTPNEQSRVWSEIISVSAKPNANATSQQQQVNDAQLSPQQHRNTRTMSAAVAPELSNFGAVSAHAEANGTAVTNAQLKYQEYLSKPAIQIYAVKIGDVIKTLFSCFCSGLEPLLPGFSAWASEHAYLLLTVPLETGSNEMLLQEMVNAIMSQNFPLANTKYQDWLLTCTDSLYETWREDIAFVIAKTSFDGSIAQYCQSFATQLMPMDQPLFTQLSQQHPTSFVEMASLVGCDCVDAQHIQQGMGYLMGMAQQQMQGSGQQASNEQLQMMIQQSNQQQCQQLQQGMAQQGAMVQQLAQVYLANYPKNASSSSTASPPVAAADSTGTPVQSAESEAMDKLNAVLTDDSNMFNQYVTNANLLITLLQMRNTVESVSNEIMKYYTRKQKHEIASLFSIENRTKIAAVKPDTEVVNQLKSIAQQVPDPSQTPLLAQSVAQRLQEIKTSNSVSFLHDSSDDADSIREKLINDLMSDPIFILLQELLHSLVLEVHQNAHQMFLSAVPHDPSGVLLKLSELIATPQGLEDFISFELKPQQRQMAVQVLAQDPALHEQFNNKNDETVKQTIGYIGMVTKDIIPVYLSQLDIAYIRGSSGIIEVKEDIDPFLPMYSGMFAPTGLVDPGKFQLYSQFCTFRRSVRNDVSLLPKVLNAIAGNEPFLQMHALISNNTNYYLNGSMLPEDLNIGYSSTKDTKILTWHEADLMKPPSPNMPIDPLANCCQEITFLLVKRSIMETPTGEMVASCQQQLMQWGQQQFAQLLPMHVNEMLQACGGKLSPIELSRLNSYDDVQESQLMLRRKLNLGNRDELTKKVDAFRVEAVSAGSGFSGLETLMLLHHFSNDASSMKNPLSAGGGGGSETSSSAIDKLSAASIQATYNRFMQRDAEKLKLLEAYGNKMKQEGDSLLKVEVNKLKQVCCQGILREFMPVVEKGQYGATITSDTDAASIDGRTSCVMPPIDLEILPYSIKLIVLEHIKYLTSVVDFVTQRDQFHQIDVIDAARKSSVFEKHYNGGHLGTSTQFLLWKLEFIGANTAEDCHQQIYLEEKLLGTLIFENMSAFRDEPFHIQELATIREVLSIASQKLSMSISGPNASPFSSLFDNEFFLREKVWAQQTRDKILKTLQQGTNNNISQLVMARFRSDPNLKTMVSIVENNMEKFLNDPLSIQQQETGWKHYINLEFQSRVASGNNVEYEGNRPELAKIIYSKNIQKLNQFLSSNMHVDKITLFATYGHNHDQCYMIDAAKTDIEMVKILLQNNYPIAQQVIVSSDAKEWPILCYLILYWSEQLKEKDASKQALYDRFSACIELFVSRGCSLAMISNGMSPLYLAAVTSNYQAVEEIVRVYQSLLNIAPEVCLNYFIPTEQYAITALHAVVSGGTDYEMLKLLCRLGADKELTLDAVASDFTITQSSPPLHIVLDQSHDGNFAQMAKELIALGCKVDNSIKLMPWLKSEMIKKVGRMDTVSDDVEDEANSYLMRVDTLFCCSFTTDVSLFALLIEKGANVNYVDPTSGFSVIHQVMFSPDRQHGSEDLAIELVSLLLKNGVNIDAQTTTGNTALYLACQKKLSKIAKFLLENGADATLGNKNKETPFHMACFVEHMPLMELLLCYAASSRSTLHKKSAPEQMNLRASIKESDESIMIHHKDIRGNDALMYSASFGKIPVYNYLIERNADPNTVNNEGRTLFLQAVIGGQKEFASYLLSEDPSVLHDVDNDGCNALHCLAKQIGPHCEDMLVINFMWLIQLGVDVLKRDKHLCLPLHYTAGGGNVQIFLSLIWKMLENEAFVNTQTNGKEDSKQSSGLMSFASICGIGLDSQQLEKLKGGGKDLVGSPLFFAAHNRRKEMVSLFLGGIPRPHEMHPLVRAAVPQAGGQCNASGNDIPFPGYYMAASDGANFGINEDVYESSVAAANKAKNDKSEVKWNQLSSIHLRFLEPIELTELLCYAIDVVDADLVELLISKGAGVNTPDLNGKRPLQYAAAAYKEDDEKEPGTSSPMTGGFQVQNPLEGQLSGNYDINVGKERIRTLLVENGAQVFIASDDANRGRHVRDQVSGHTMLHRMVWNKKPVQLLNPAAQEMIKSDDDDLNRLPSHHAAARGSIPWLRVLKEYHGDLPTEKDAENWLCLHEAAYGGQLQVIKLLLSWRQGQLSNLYKVYLRSGQYPTQMHCLYAAQMSVYSLEAETLYGETALELAIRGKTELICETRLGLFRVRVTQWSVFGMLVGSFVGMVVGNILNNTGGGFALGLLFGLLGTWGLCAYFALRDWFTEKVNVRKKGTPSIEEVKKVQEASKKAQDALLEKEVKLKEYDKIIAYLKQSGARNTLQRWLSVKIWRNVSFAIFTIYCGILLPFCQLRDLIGGKLLSESFLKLKTFGNGQVSTVTSMIALAFYLFFIIVPFIILNAESTYAINIAAVYIIFLFLWVLLILYRALREERLWKEPVKNSNKGNVRSNVSNISVFLVLFFEWQQLASIGFFPEISWPVSVNIQAWYSVFSLNLQSLGQTCGFDNFLLVPELSSVPSILSGNNTQLEEYAQFYDAANSLNDLSNSSAFSFWINFTYVMVWFLIIGYLAACCVVRNSKDLQTKYPFIRSDFYGQLPGANLVMPLLASGFFLSILTSFLGVLSCAYTPSAKDIDTSSSGYDDEEVLLLRLNELECFHHDHKKSVMLSLIGLLFYMPSAFLVGISFLNDEKDNNLDVRFIIAYEVIVNFVKVAIGLLVLFSAQSAVPLFIFMMVFLGGLGYATYSTKPCREIKEVNILRTSFHASAIFCTFCAAVAYGIDDDENNVPVVLFFLGNILLFAIFIISYFKIPTFFTLPTSFISDTTNLLSSNEDNSTTTVELPAMTSEGSRLGNRVNKRRVSSIIMKLKDEDGALAGERFEQEMLAAKQAARHEATAFLEDALSMLDPVSSVFGLGE